MPPLVVAVVLTWNDTELTRGCLRSVFANDYPNLQVVLVDNGSIPPVGTELERDFPEVSLVQNPHNQGFSGGANRGLEKALELGAVYIHLIGNDATLSPDTISNLVATAESNPEGCAFGPLLLDPGEERVVQFYTASLDRERTKHVHHHVGEAYDKNSWPVAVCEFIPCVALMFRAKALVQSGLFDESFGTCWEDYDLCLRLRDAGWKYFAVGNATAVHIGSHTTGRISPYIVYHDTRNRLTCIGRHAGKGAVRRHFVHYVRSFKNTVTQYGFFNWSCHLAFIKAFWHYLIKVQGEESRSKTRSGIPGLGS